MDRTWYRKKKSQSYPASTTPWQGPLGSLKSDGGALSLSEHSGSLPFGINHFANTSADGETQLIHSPVNEAWPVPPSPPLFNQDRALPRLGSSFQPPASSTPPLPGLPWFTALLPGRFCKALVSAGSQGTAQAAPLQRPEHKGLRDRSEKPGGCALLCKTASTVCECEVLTEICWLRGPAAPTWQGELSLGSYACEEAWICKTN